MVAVVSGSGLGLFNSSAAGLGNAGVSGNGNLGQAKEQVYVNSATGNLVVQHQDDFLTGLGLDVGVIRTYNSQGKLDDDNGDNWKIGLYRRVYGLTGTVNTTGSTVVKVFGDGAEVTYTYDTALAKYVSSDGEGAHDTLTWTAGTSQWTWTDGSARNTETYDSVGKLLNSKDADGNQITYNYTGTLLTSVVDASTPVQTTYLDYTGNNLTQVRVVSNSVTQTLTRYAYDGQNRLQTVTVDLSPGDNAISDANTYTTTYTYDGTSKRIASITQKDGTTVSFTYQLIDGAYRVKTHTDGNNNVTTLNYSSASTTGGGGSTSATANSGVLSTTDTQNTPYALNSGALSTTQTTNTPYSLNSGALTTPPSGWAATATLLENTNTAAAQPKTAFDANGDGFAVWAQGNDLMVSRYTRANDTWSTAVARDNLGVAVNAPSLAMDAAGNAIVGWVQSDGTAESVYVIRYTASNSTWSMAAQIDNLGTGVTTTAGSVAVSINGTIAAAAWVQTSTNNNLYASRFNGTTWSTPALLESRTNAVTVPSLAVDGLGNVNVVWQQSNGSANSIYRSRYSVGTSSWAATATLLENTNTAAAQPKTAFDANGDGFAVWAQGNDLMVSRYTRANDTWSTAVARDNLGVAVNAPSLAMDAAGNAIVGWVQSDGTAESVYVIRYTASNSTWSMAAQIDNLGTGVTTTAGSVAVSINGTIAAAAWVQTSTNNNLYASRFNGTTWSTPALLESRTNAVTVPSLAVDGLGNVNVVWQQSNGSANSIYSGRFTNASGAPYYTIPASSTWQTVANTLYGINSSAAGTALQTAMGGGALSAAGTQVTGWPATLTVTTTITVPAYYTIPASATWQTVANTLYGVNSAAAGTALQAAMGGGALPQAGTPVTGWPSTLTVTTTITVPAYYLVQGTDTWTTITQTVYGTSDANAVAALQLATGNPTLMVNFHLTVPSTLTYSTGGGSQTLYLQTDVVDALSQTTTYTQDASGRLTSVLSPTVNGVRLTTQYAYDTSGNLTSLTQDPSGLNRVTTFQYDSAGNLLLSRDAAGNTVTRTYSTNSQLLTETTYVVADPDGAGAGQPSAPLTSRYAYDSEDHLRFTVTADGRVTEYRYNTVGQRIAQLTYAGSVYDVSAMAPTATLSESTLNTWVNLGSTDKTKVERIDYTYDWRGNVTTATAYATTDSAGVGIATGSSKTQYVYDQRGQLLQTLSPLGTATTPNGNITNLPYATTYTYDGLGRLVSATEWVANANFATAKTHSTLYDDVNNRIVTTHANGLISTTVYDRTGAITSVINGIAGNTNSLGTTTYTYDTEGRLRMVTDPTGVKTFTLYDAASRKVGAIDGDGTLMEYVYNADNQVIKTIKYADAVNSTFLTSLAVANNPLLNDVRGAIGTTEGRAKDQINRSVYDAAGRLVYTIDPVGAVTQLFYDGLSRVTDKIQYIYILSIPSSVDQILPSQLTSGGAYAIYTSAFDDRLTRNFYDNDGHLIGFLDADRFLVEYIYNAAGNMVQQIRYANMCVHVPASTSTLDQLRADAIVNDPTFIDGYYEQHIYTYFYYDGEGRQIGVLDGEGYLTEIVYDEDGQVVQSTRYDRQLDYNPSLTTLKEDILSTDQRMTTLYTYDGAGRVSSQTERQGTVAAYVDVVATYIYDAADHLISSTRAFGASAARTTQTQYDALGRVTRELSAEGAAVLQANQLPIATVWDRYSISYTYDVAGRKISATRTPYDPISNTSQTNTTYFYYNEDGQLRFAVNALGERTESRYNALGQLAETLQYTNRISTAGLTGGLLTTSLQMILSASPNTSIDGKTGYTYDLVGRTHSVVTASGTRTSYSINAFGDAVYVRTKVNPYYERTDSYTYDKRGNIRSEQLSTTGGALVSRAYRYDAFGRVYYDQDGHVNVTYTKYDRLGRIITSVDPLNGQRIVAYDAFSRTTQITDPNNNVTTYQYADATRSVQVTSPKGVVTTVLNEFGQVKNVTDEGGSVTRTEFNHDGQVSDVTVAYGTSDASTTHYVYDSTNRTVTIIEGYGSATQRITRYEYDQAGRRTFEIVDPATLGGTLNLITQYKYDGKGNLSRKIDPTLASTWYVYDADNRITHTIDALGGVTKTTYNEAGLVSSTRRFSEKVPVPTDDVVSTVSIAISTDDRHEQYVYDYLGRVVFTIRDVVIGGVNRAIVTKNVYEYGRSNIVRTILYANDIAAGDYKNLTAYGDGGYPSPGFTVVADINKDRVQSTAYDKNNRAVFSVDAAGAVTQYQYDANGNVIKTIAYATADASLIGTANASDASYLTNTWVPAHTAAADRVTRYWYDGVNLVRFTLDAGGYLKETQYLDSSRQQVSTLYYTATTNTPATTILASDTLAQVAAKAAALANPNLNQITTTLYDAAGRVSRVTDATQVYYEEYKYDAVGNKISYRNQKGEVWNYTYDANRRLTEELSPWVTVTTVTEQGSGSTASLVTGTADYRIRTAIEYDALGNVIERTEAANVPGQSRTTTYEYDALGRQTITRFPEVRIYNEAADTSPNTGTYQTTQDTAAFLYSEVSYDTLGNAFRNRDVAGSYSFKVFDKLGRVQYEVDARNFVTGYEYDVFGNQASITRYSKPLGNSSDTPALPTTGNAVITASAITSPGMLQLTVAEDRKIEKSYDRLNRVTQVIQPLVYTFDNAPGAIPGDQQPTTEYLYDAFGYVTRERRALSNTRNADTHYFYNRLGQKTDQVDAEGYVTHYSYDETGDLTSQIEYAKQVSTSWVPGQSIPTPDDQSGLNRETTYVYDQLNRQVSVTQHHIVFSSVISGNSGNSATRDGDSNLTTTYAYDAVGNQTAVAVNGAVTYTYYDALGRTLAIAEPTRNVGDGELTPITTMKRDAFGNMVEQIQYANGASYASEAGFSAVSVEPAASPLGARRQTLTYGNGALTIFNENGVSSTNGTQIVENLTHQDRITRLKYDTHGKVTHTEDATGADRYASYNERGEVAKEWQYVTNEGVPTEALVTRYEYDKLGQQATIIEPQTLGTFGTPVVVITKRALYNAFGEVTLKSIDGATQTEYFDYDQAGRVWRSNSGDGVDKVYLYNLEGKSTAEIRVSSDSSITTLPDLETTLGDNARVASAALQADTSSNYVRTLTAYDKLGRTTQQVQAGFAAQAQPQTPITGVQISNLTGAAWLISWPSPSATVQQLFEYRLLGSGSTWSSMLVDSNQVTSSVNVSSLLGDYEFRLTYRLIGQTDAFAIHTGTLEVEATNTGPTAIDLEWGPAETPIPEYIYNSVFSYKPVNSTEWISLDPNIHFYATRLTGIQRDTLYDFRVDDGWTRYEQFTNEVMESWTRTVTGHFSVSGDIVTTADASYSAVYYAYQSNPSYYSGAITATGSIPFGSTRTATIIDTTDVSLGLTRQVVIPTLDQLVDRWGNVIESTDAVDNTIRYEYNQFNQLTKVTHLNVDVLETQGVSSLTLGTTVSSENHYDLLGQLIATKDANGNVNLNRYNEAGQMVGERHADDNTANANTVSHVYNAFGEQIQTTDALGYRTRSTYDKVGNLSAVLQQVTSTGFDALGSAPYALGAGTRSATGAWSWTTLPDEVNTVGYNYRYDEAGRRIAETNGAKMEVGGGAETTKYWYDLQGNVIKRRTPRGRDTDYQYDQFGMGKKTRETMPVISSYFAADYQTWTYDYFGKLTDHRDLGGANYHYNYNGESQLLTSQQRVSSAGQPVPGQYIEYKYDSAGHMVRIHDRGTAYTGTGVQADFTIDTNLAAVNRDTYYGYDAAGRRVLEKVVHEVGTANEVVHQHTIINYDSMGRIKTLSDPRYQTTYSYDAAGNRSRILSQYSNLSNQTTINDLWYTYDAMNRVDISQGVGSIGNAVTINSTQGTDLGYDLKGQRISAETNGKVLSIQTGWVNDPEWGIFPIDPNYPIYRETNGLATGYYTYDGLGRLTAASRKATTLYYGQTGNLESSTVTAPLVVDTRQYDGAGRVVYQKVVEVEYEALSNSETFSSYEDDGRLKWHSLKKDGSWVWSSGYGDSVYSPDITTTGTIDIYDPFTDTYSQQPYENTVPAHWSVGYDAAGTLRSYFVSVFTPTGGTNTSMHAFEYRKGDAYQEVSESVNSQGVVLNGKTQRSYNANGELVQFVDTQDAYKNRYFANDQSGNALTVVQVEWVGQVFSTPQSVLKFAINSIGDRNFKDPYRTQNFFFANGQQVGSLQSLGNPDFYLGPFTQYIRPNFDVNYTPISPRYPANAPSEVVVQQGDTLKLVAARVFGDATLWYLIAQENGLAEPDELLAVGTLLRIPNNVVSLKNDSTTFKPFSVSDALGDTTPTQPLPPPPAAAANGKKGCGVIGQIIMIVVVIIVTIYTAGAASGAFASAGTSVGTAAGATAATGASTMAIGGSVLAGTATGISAGGMIAAAAIGGAVGAAAGQLAAMAMGMQDKFDWKGVALGAIGAGVTAGLGTVGALGGSSYGAIAVRAAAGNAITQGIAVATGLQERFSWRDVAISAVAAPIANSVGNAVGGALGSTFAGQFAGGVTGSLVRGAFDGKIDMATVLADAFGNALGNSIVDKSVPKTESAASRRAKFANGDYDNVSTTSSSPTGDPLAGMELPELALPEDWLNIAVDTPMLSVAQDLSNNPRGTLRVSKASPDQAKSKVTPIDPNSFYGTFQESQRTGKSMDRIAIERGDFDVPMSGGSMAIPGMGLANLSGVANAVEGISNFVSDVGDKISDAYHSLDIAPIQRAQQSGINQQLALIDQLGDDNSFGANYLRANAYEAIGNIQTAPSNYLDIALEAGGVLGAFGKVGTTARAFDEVGGVASKSTSLTYDISKWGEYGLPSDGVFARTLNPEQYRAFKAGREFSFGGKGVDGYPNGMGFIGSAEEVSGLTTMQGYREGLKLGYDPKFVLEFQLRSPSSLQNVIKAPYAEFKYGGQTGAGFKEWNYPGITSSDIVNPRVRVLK